MATAVSICSNALVLLGDRPISAFTEDTDSCRAASNLWPGTRNAMLRSHPWNCAVKRVVLSPDVTAPAFSYAYRYLKPSDWLRTIAVGEDGYETDFKSEGRHFLSDESTLYLRYIWRNEDPASYDEMLVEALTLAMAAKLAFPITKSSVVKDAAGADLVRYMKAARAVDGQDDPPETLGDFPFLSARR